MKANTVFKSAADRMRAKDLEGKIVVGEFANTTKDENTSNPSKHTLVSEDLSDLSKKIDKGKEEKEVYSYYYKHLNFKEFIILQQKHIQISQDVSVQL